MSPTGGWSGSTGDRASATPPEKGRYLAEMLKPILVQAIAYLWSDEREGVFLDIGCGRADRTFEFSQLPSVTVGTDINRRVLSRAKQNRPDLRLVVADIHRLPFRDRSVNGVLSVSVLQYVEQDTVLHEISRVLVDGGRFACIENLGGHPFARGYRYLRRARGRSYGRYVVPREHLNWRRLEKFEEYFRVATIVPYVLTSMVPYAAVLAVARLFGEQPTPGRIFGRLSELDHWILARSRKMGRFAWIVLIEGVRR